MAGPAGCDDGWTIGRGSHCQWGRGSKWTLTVTLGVDLYKELWGFENENHFILPLLRLCGLSVLHGKFGNIA